MRSHTLLVAGLVAIVAAAPAPVPQDIDFDLVYALPDPTYTTASDVTAQTVSYTASVIYESALSQILATTTTDLPLTTDAPEKRAAACAALPTGAGPLASPDTPTDFLAVPDFAANANAASTPSGYTQTFQNLNSSNNAYGYLGYTSLKSYDVASCAAKCNAINGCVAFNIYYERDPTVDPGSGASGCTNPASTTFIKCAWWGGPVTTANANNYGQWRNQFQVVIAGSNGYVSNAIASVPGYGTAIPLGNAAINAPYDSYGFDSYMGVAMFTSGPFNASLCAQACSDKSAFALAHPPTDGSPVQTCQFFNTYILYINSTSNPNSIQGQYCAMYSESWPKSYATNVGQYRGYDHFMIEYSFAFSNSTNPGTPNANAAVHQASKDISWSTLQPFCSSILGYTVPSTTVATTVTTTPVSTATAYTTATVTSFTLAKRDDNDTITSIPPEIDALMRGPLPTGVDKRAISTPDVLTKYPASIVSSACSLQATPATSTSTITTLTTTTAPATTTTVTATTTAVVTACSPDRNAFIMKISAPGTTYDGAIVQNPDAPYYYTGISTDHYYQSMAPLVWSLDPNTGFVKSKAGLYFGRSNTGANLAQGRMSQGSNDPANSGQNVCSIDSNTLEFTCTSTERGTSYSNFYITSNSLLQLSLGSAGLAGTNGFSQSFPAVPVKVYASC